MTNNIFWWPFYHRNWFLVNSKSRILFISRFYSTFNLFYFIFHLKLSMIFYYPTIWSSPSQFIALSLLIIKHIHHPSGRYLEPLCYGSFLINFFWSSKSYFKIVDLYYKFCFHMMNMMISYYDTNELWN